MFRVSFDFGWTAGVAFNQDTGSDSGLKKRRSIEQGPTGKNFLGRPDVGHDLFGGEFCACAQPCQCGGSGHQFQHIATIDCVVAFSRAGRKFVLMKFLGFPGSRELFKTLPETRGACAGKLRARRNQVDRILRVEIFAHRLAFITGDTSNRSANSARGIPP